MRVSCLGLVILATACGRSPVQPVEPALGLSPAFLRFAARVGEVVEPVAVSVVGAGDLPLAWRAVGGAPWLVLDPRRGRTPGVVFVGVVTRDVEPGVHRAGVTLISADNEAVSVALTVELVLEAPGWTALSGPYGAPISTLAVDSTDAGRVLAGGQWGELYLSTDGGESFSRLPDMLCCDSIEAIELNGPERSYLAVDNQGVFFSDDGGMSWEASGLQNLDIYTVVSDASHHQTVLAEGDGLWRSADGGATWEDLSQPAGTNFVARHPTRAGGFVAGGDDGSWYDIDGADVFEHPTGIGGPITALVGLADGRWVLTRYDGEISNTATSSVSDDAGQTWRRAGTGLPEDKYERLFLTVAEDGLWAFHGWSTNVSTNGGESFNHIALDFRRGSSQGWYADVVSHPDGMLAAHLGEGVLRQVPGSGWRQSQVFANWIPCLELHAASGALVVCSEGEGLYRRGPAGVWEGLDGADYHSYAWAVSVDPRNSSVMLAALSYELHQTLDGGQTWHRVGAGLSGSFDGLARAPDDPDVVWFLDDALQISTDGGVVFAHADDLPDGKLAAVSANVALVEGNDEVWRYDRIADQSTQVGGDGDSSISCLVRSVDGSMWYAGGAEGVMRSGDGGLTFTSLGHADLDVWDVEVDPFDPSTIYLAAAVGLLVSRDGGGSWQDAGAPFPVERLVADPVTGALYVATSGGGVYTYSP